MAQEATINARLDETLKRNGTAVLERDGVSPTQLIRSLYRYLESEQRIPDCLDIRPDARQAQIQRKHNLACRIAGTITLPEGVDVKQLQTQRRAQKYGDLL